MAHRFVHLLLAAGLAAISSDTLAGRADIVPKTQASPQVASPITDILPQAQAARQVTSPITVRLPQLDAALTVNDAVVPGPGSTRTFQSPPLRAGETQTYTFTVEWQPNSYTTMTRSRVVSFRAGDPVKVDLSVEAPTDRVRVIYVPTPDDIAQEMVKLADIRSTDVVFEPGCGDARVLIAAVRAGARRGVGIDIDPERVEESRARVRDAGLADRIEIRLGDALDVPDLSQMTVVLLYMGDHFNMLIRPRLWKALPVGARVVSHRFEMGDWKPDKTAGVTGIDGIGYELHLWTITPDVKRRVTPRPVALFIEPIPAAAPWPPDTAGTGPASTSSRDRASSDRRPGSARRAPRRRCDRPAGAACSSTRRGPIARA
jgi:uncharacterized protein (TIGR03000 family)